MRLSELDWAYVEERAAYFTGRRWVFTRLDEFLRGAAGVFLLLGAPGTGKTAVAAQLARATAGRLRAGGSADMALPVDAAYFCRAGRIDLLDVAQRLSDQLAEVVPLFDRALRASLAPEINVGEVQVQTADVAQGASVAGLRIDLSAFGPERAFLGGLTLPLRRLRESGNTTRVVLLIDALDESLASQATDALPRLLDALEHVHLVVTSRDDARATGGLRDRAKVAIDLMADAPRDSNDVLEYLHHRLGSQGGPRPMGLLAERIAARASGNFLWAHYVVEGLIRGEALRELDEPAVQQLSLPEGGLPGIYRDFLRRELWRDDHAWSEQFRPVLAPLTVAQDEGLNTDQLARVADRFRGRPMSPTAVRDVTRKAWQFLQGSRPHGPFRLYHRSFADFLVDAERNPDFLIDPAEAHEAIVAAYTAADPATWDRYARRNVAIHAARVDRLDDLLDDPRFLLAIEPDRLLPVLPLAVEPQAVQAARTYQHAVAQFRGRPVGEVAAYLQLHARQLGHSQLVDQLDRLRLGQPWRVPWACWRPLQTNRTIGRHDRAVTALALGMLDDRPTVVSGGADRTVRVWELASGTPIGQPLSGHQVPPPAAFFGGGNCVTAVATVVLDGRPVVVSAGDDQTVRVWELAGRAPIGQPLTGHTGGPVHDVAVGELDGRPVVVSAGWDGTVRVWELASGIPIGHPIQESGPVRSVALGELGGRSVIVAGSVHGPIRLWELPGGTPIGQPLTGHDGSVNAVAVGNVAGQPVIISAGRDGTLRLWELPGGTPIGQPLTGHDGSVNAVAVGNVAGRPVIISASDDQTVRLWELPGGTPIGEPRTGHEGGVNAVAAGVLDGRPVVVAGNGDGMVRVWELATGAPIGQPLTGCVSYLDPEVTAVAVAELDGRSVIVSAGHDLQVRVWELAGGAPIGQPFETNQGWLNAVAVGALDGWPVVVSAGYDGSLRRWELASGAPLGPPLTGHDAAVNAVAVGALDGQPVIISGGADRTVRVWELGGSDGSGIVVHVGSTVRAVGAPAAGLAVIGTAMGLLALDFTGYPARDQTAVGSL